MLITAASVTAQQSVEGFPTISVTGTAEINVVPDEVTFTAKVEKTAKTLAEAKQLNDASLATLPAAMNSLQMRTVTNATIRRS